MPGSPSPALPAPGTQVLEDTETRQKHRHAPLYHVVLHDDDKHTYDYVVLMLMELFGMSAEKAFEHACEVDGSGITIVATTNLERAELKRDQIRAYGPDPLIKDSPGSMSATVEPAD